MRRRTQITGDRSRSSDGKRWSRPSLLELLPRRRNSVCRELRAIGDFCASIRRYSRGSDSGHRRAMRDIGLLGRQSAAMKDSKFTSGFRPQKTKWPLWTASDPENRDRVAVPFTLEVERHGFRSAGLRKVQSSNLTLLVAIQRRCQMRRRCGLADVQRRSFSSPTIPAARTPGATRCFVL